MLYAHSLPGKPKEKWQTLKEHLGKVAELTRYFASSFGALITGKLLGLLHDIGKNTKEAQHRLEGGRRVDHATAGARYLLEEWTKGDSSSREGRALAYLLGYALVGHHGGMPDYGASAAEEGSLLQRLSDQRCSELPDWRKGPLPELPPFSSIARELLPLMSNVQGKFDAFSCSMLIRMLYSCLVDADFLDTERFCAPDRHRMRVTWPSVEVLEERLEHSLRERGFLSQKVILPEELHCSAEDEKKQKGVRINLARQYILQCCREAAQNKPGVFELTVPTGGGKTLSSLAFALSHARKHGMKRVIFVVPYTSIIEQNAQEYRKVLGEDAVLEHHSNYVHTKDGEVDEDSTEALQFRLSAENWDATVIVTTAVQFFESLFAHGPAQCRKLHNIVGSVVILDEVQQIPVPFVKPCVSALKVLAWQYHVSIVLCTATQPALYASPLLPEGFTKDEVRSLIPLESSPFLFSIFQRTRLSVIGECSDEELVQRLNGEKQVLCIVNSRRYARELFMLLKEDDANFHLSARMTPAHRSRVLAKIRSCLEAGQNCRVVSTSLVECGVDISFPVVFRERNGLDVLAQAAGRCNRHGEQDTGQVFVFDSDKPLARRAAELARRRTAFDSVADRQGDLFSPSCIDAYFRALYGASSLDEKNILQTMKRENGQTFGAFQFASIDRAFRFIEEQTTLVVIDNEDAENILRELRQSVVASPDLLRRLQRYSVQVYGGELKELQKTGRIELWHDCIPILSGGVGYDEKLGLDVKLEAGIDVETLYF